jgi:hypothetical protein
VCIRTMDQPWNIQRFFPLATSSLTKWMNEGFFVVSYSFP